MKSLLACGALLLLAALTSADTLGARNPIPQGWNVKSSAKAALDEKVEIALAFRRPHMDKLTKIVDDFSNPKSANWGNRLSHEEVTKLVSPGKKAIREVRNWLARHGVSQVDVARHEDSCKFTATRAQAASLFGVRWAVYENKKSKMTSTNAMGEVQIPDHLFSTIELVSGLESFPEPQAKPLKKNLEQGNITPSKIQSLYNITENMATPPTTNIQSFFQAQGQAVAQDDLTKFCSQYIGSDYSGPCKIEKYVGGKDQSFPGEESALDSQYILAIGRRPTWAYTYNSFNFCKDLTTWGQDVFGEKDGTYPFVISMSYGSQQFPNYCTSEISRLADDVKKMGAMGISVMIASGDMGSGYYSREGFNNGYLTPSFPAEIPYATSVGATQYDDSFKTEQPAYFSGGGFAWNYTLQDYQKDAVDAYMKKVESGSVTKPKGTYNYNAAGTSGRATPDIALVGVNFEIEFQGSSTPVSGTSCSTPTFGGMVSQLNNIALQHGKTLGFLNPFLYQNADCFMDITSGNNANGYPGYGWTASEGWDAASGLGSPDFGCLASRIKGGSGPVTPAPANGQSFTVETCADGTCTNCNSVTKPQNTCIVAGSNSFIASCTADSLVISTYKGSTTCTGAFTTVAEPINTCEVEFDPSGKTSSYKNLCNAPTKPPITAQPTVPPTPAPSAISFEYGNYVSGECGRPGDYGDWAFISHTVQASNEWYHLPIFNVDLRYTGGDNLEFMIKSDATDCQPGLGAKCILLAGKSTAIPTTADPNCSFQTLIQHDSSSDCYLEAIRNLKKVSSETVLEEQKTTTSTETIAKAKMFTMKKSMENRKNFRL